MFIKLIPTQIPIFWETIKYGCKKADIVPVDKYQPYFNELLQALLSDKAQCFVRLNNDRKLLAILVTRILGNKISGDKTLFLQTVYSFEVVPQTIWEENFKTLIDMAKKNNCKTISFNTNNRSIIDKVLKIGCVETTRSYEYNIGGV